MKGGILYPRGTPVKIVNSMVYEGSTGVMMGDACSSGAVVEVRLDTVVRIFLRMCCLDPLEEIHEGA